MELEYYSSEPEEGSRGSNTTPSISPDTILLLSRLFPWILHDYPSHNHGRPRPCMNLSVLIEGCQCDNDNVIIISPIDDNTQSCLGLSIIYCPTLHPYKVRSLSEYQYPHIHTKYANVDSPACTTVLWLCQCLFSLLYFLIKSLHLKHKTEKYADDRMNKKWIKHSILL